MSVTTKPLSDVDGIQTLQRSFNDSDASINVNGFLVGIVGRRVDLTIGTTNSANDTETYAFSENGLALYTLQIVYTDGTRTTLLYAQRTV